MKNIQFVKVFSNDVSLNQVSRELLKSKAAVIEHRSGNSPAKYEGVWKGKMAVLGGSIVTETKGNNTVAGYEPTEWEQFEVTIFDGDVFTWRSGSVCSFEHIRIER